MRLKFSNKATEMQEVWQPAILISCLLTESTMICEVWHKLCLTGIHHCITQ